MAGRIIHRYRLKELCIRRIKSKALQRSVNRRIITKRGDKEVSEKHSVSIPCLKGLIIDSLIPFYITETLGESHTLITSLVLLGKGEKEAKRILKSITGYRYCEIVALIEKDVMRLLLCHLMNAFVIVIFFSISSCEGSWLMKILLMLHKNRVVAKFIQE